MLRIEKIKTLHNNNHHHRVLWGRKTNILCENSSLTPCNIYCQLWDFILFSQHNFLIRIYMPYFLHLSLFYLQHNFLIVFLLSTMNVLFSYMRIAYIFATLIILSSFKDFNFHLNICRDIPLVPSLNCNSSTLDHLF